MRRIPSVSARSSLMRMLQELFETRLLGAYRWDQVAHVPAEKAKPEPGRSRPIHGQLLEIVAVRFGGFELTLESPRESPPLGRAVLRHRGRVIALGPIDASTWDDFAVLIKDQPLEKRITENVAGQPW